ncbi:Arm DNA-binding domain-containing protein [Fictibacillus enclensis]|uniref:Arm DNA-binding domain-containing protein n=1 Tax=Fictibacillus enclensis TaxID=1017270 RepID=UPI000A5611F7|nr:Arm DNA-binding domain-containing protein [Fictibacillus enclensis]
MAYFRKSSNGKWSYTISLGIDPLTKVQKQKTKSGFPTKKEAVSAARALEAEVEAGTYIKESKMTFQSFTDDWIKAYGQNAKVSSVRARSKELKHFTSVWGPYPLNKITRRDYQKRIIELSEQYSKNYLSGIHACGRLIFKHAVALEFIKINPTENIQLPKQRIEVEEIENQEKEMKFLEKEELALFLRLCDMEGLDLDSLIFTTLS